jgi:predicted hydrolase (HD superfamily)
VETAPWHPEAAVKRNKFGVLHVHDLQKRLKEKGFPPGGSALKAVAEDVERETMRMIDEAR